LFISDYLDQLKIKFFRFTNSKKIEAGNNEKSDKLGVFKDSCTKLFETFKSEVEKDLKNFEDHLNKNKPNKKD
jgi:hypothetical protein